MSNEKSKKIYLSNVSPENHREMKWSFSRKSYQIFCSSFSNLPIVLHKIPEPRSIRRGKVNDGQEIIPFFKLKFLELSLSIECGGEKMFLVLGGAPLWLYCSLFWVKSKLQYYAVIAKMYRISTLTWSREWLVTKNWGLRFDTVIRYVDMVRFKHKQI